VYLSSLCVVPLLSSRLTASALVWFSNFLKYSIVGIATGYGLDDEGVAVRVLVG
jgi:hypothetical protein